MAACLLLCPRLCSWTLLALLTTFLRLFAGTARSPSSIPAQGLNPVPSKVQHLPGKTGPPVCGSLSRSNTPDSQRPRRAAPGPLPLQADLCHKALQQRQPPVTYPLRSWGQETQTLYIPGPLSLALRLEMAGIPLALGFLSISCRGVRGLPLQSHCLNLRLSSLHRKPD